jgi:hypothetical protein
LHFFLVYHAPLLLLRDFGDRRPRLGPRGRAGLGWARPKDRLPFR